MPPELSDPDLTSEIFTLLESGPASYKEIAALTGVPVRRVKTIVRKNMDVFEHGEVIALYVVWQRAEGGTKLTSIHCGGGFRRPVAPQRDQRTERGSAAR